MSSQFHLADLAQQLKRALHPLEDVLFAYLYGSRTVDFELPGADIDVAVYLQASDLEQYLQKRIGLDFGFLSSY